MNQANETTKQTKKDVKEQKLKISGASKASILLSISGVLFSLTGLLMPIGIAALVAGFFIGIAALVEIKLSGGRMKGTGLAIAGISMAVVVFTIHLLIVHSVSSFQADAIRVFCSKNLTQLGKAMLTYSEDFDGKYPIQDEWCDLLLKYDYINKDSHSLECPGARKQGRHSHCHYAMNPNCDPNSPPDMILLFETKGGWNQYGGMELASIDNHTPTGCNILFNDGHVEFIKTEQLDKLRWKAKENKNKKADSVSSKE